MKNITWLHLLSVGRGPFPVVRAHQRHFEELRAELSRGGLLSGMTRKKHTTGEIASNSSDSN